MWAQSKFAMQVIFRVIGVLDVCLLPFLKQERRARHGQAIQPYRQMFSAGRARLAWKTVRLQPHH
jgi:hypothetical protein